ncbi:MAG TPA: hypothetical protein VJO34_05975 [Methylomirabilota bacterium]|nr:hypothetical protein [Methylomirabilota bacterium]
MSDENARPEQNETRGNDESEESRHRSLRRKFIKSTVAALPVVLTVSAGTAHASGGIGSGSH